MNRKRKRIFSKAAGWAAAALCLVSAQVAAETGPATLRHIRYGFTLKNTSGNLLENATFWTYAPVKQTSHQRCVQLSSSHAYRLNEDMFGNRIMAFNLGRIPPYGVRIVTIEADLEMCRAPRNLDGPPAQLYQRPERLMDFSDPRFLRELPPRLRFGKMQDPKEIFSWVRGRIRDAGYLGKDRGALYALREKQGDCTEFSSLFTALCRLQGFPSRRIGGVVARQNIVVRPALYHNWSEVFQDGAWRIADPQNNGWREGGENYVVLQILSEDPGRPIPGWALYHAEGNELQIEMNR